jgi:hypothetical protein
VSAPVQLGDPITNTALLLRVVASPDVDRAVGDIRVALPMTIGRELACEVVLNEKTVSRRHARVEPTSEGLRLTDLGSSNGIWVGAERIQQATLVNGDRFRIGSTVFECVCVAAGPLPEPANSTSPSPHRSLPPLYRRPFPKARRRHPS